MIAWLTPLLCLIGTTKLKLVSSFVVPSSPTAAVAPRINNKPHQFITSLDNRHTTYSRAAAVISSTTSLRSDFLSSFVEENVLPLSPELTSIYYNKKKGHEFKILDRLNRQIDNAVANRQDKLEELVSTRMRRMLLNGAYLSIFCGLFLIFCQSYSPDGKHLDAPYSIFEYQYQQTFTEQQSQLTFLSDADVADYAWSLVLIEDYVKSYIFFLLILFALLTVPGISSYIVQQMLLPNVRMEEIKQMGLTPAALKSVEKLRTEIEDYTNKINNFGESQEELKYNLDEMNKRARDAEAGLLLLLQKSDGAK